MSEHPIADWLGAPGNVASFHQGDAPQSLPTAPGADPSEADVAALAADRARLRVPESRPRWGTDEDGVPIEPSPLGMVFNEETGAVEMLEVPDPDAEPSPEPAPAPAPEPPAPAPEPPAPQPTATRTTATRATGTAAPAEPTPPPPA